MATTLNASPRENLGKYEVHELRESGLVPGIIYGKGKANQNISFIRKELESVIAKGEADIDLNIGGKAVPAKIVEVQYFPTGTYPSHIDLVYR